MESLHLSAGSKIVCRKSPETDGRQIVGTHYDFCFVVKEGTQDERRLLRLFHGGEQFLYMHDGREMPVLLRKVEGRNGRVYFDGDAAELKPYTPPAAMLTASPA